MLEGVRDFLVQNPGEVLVFVIEDYVTPEDVGRRVPRRAGSTASSTAAA